ncbi:MAG TPA: hypothetical protein VGH74_19215, partial [Planctomycetaceae bacterium]
WNSTDKSSEFMFAGAAQPSHKLAFSPDQRTLASEGPDETITLWNVDTGLDMATLDPHLARIDRLEFSPDGSLLIVTGWAHQRFGQAVIFRKEIDPGAPVHQPVPPTNPE